MSVIREAVHETWIDYVRKLSGISQKWENEWKQGDRNGNLCIYYECLNIGSLLQLGKIVPITIFLTERKIDILQKSDPCDEEVTKNSLLQEIVSLSASLTDESLR